MFRKKANTEYDGTSYLRFVYFDLAENMPQDFNCDMAMQFFRDSRTRHGIGEMRTTSPYEHMYRGCVASSVGDAKSISFKVTERILSHWNGDECLIPDVISCFVFQFNLTAERVAFLYRHKRFSDLSVHIIGVREDTISRDNPVWKAGHWQAVERLDNNNHTSKCAIM